MLAHSFHHFNLLAAAHLCLQRLDGVDTVTRGSALLSGSFTSSVRPQGGALRQRCKVVILIPFTGNKAY